MGKHAKGIKSRPIRLFSERDLARLACSFSNKIQFAYAFQKGKFSTTIAIPGEKAFECTNLYLLDVDRRLSGYLVYDPYTDIKDAVEWKEALDEQQVRNFKVYKIGFINMESPFDACKPSKKDRIRACRADDYKELVKLLISEHDSEEKPPKLYAFIYKGKQYACSLGMGGEEVETVMYAELPFKGRRSFFIYDYSRDSVTEADTLAGSVYPYIRIINLAEAFDFFMPA
jgi:hypothetical protein